MEQSLAGLAVEEVQRGGWELHFDLRANRRLCRCVSNDHQLQAMDINGQMGLIAQPMIGCDRAFDTVGTTAQ